MTPYEFFNQIIQHIEEMQTALNQLRETVKTKLKECASPKETTQ